MEVNEGVVDSSSHVDDVARPLPRPTVTFALAVGAYVATLVAPATVLVLARATSSPAALYVGLLAAAALVTGMVGAAVRRTPGLAVRLGADDAVLLVPLVPFGWFLAPLLGVEPTGLAVLLAVLAGLVGPSAGAVLVANSRSAHADWVTADASTLASMTIGYPRRWRRAGHVLAACCLLAGFGGFAVTFVYAIDLGMAPLYALLAPSWFLHVENDRTITVTDAGLVVERQFHRRARPWSEVTGYAATETGLIIHTRGWWPSIRCDTDDVEDLQPVLEALEDHCGSPPA